MATHSSILAWEIPWTDESGGLRSMESRRVGRDRADRQMCIEKKWFEVTVFGGELQCLHGCGVCVQVCVCFSVCPNLLSIYPELIL